MTVGQKHEPPNEDTAANHSSHRLAPLGIMHLLTHFPLSSLQHPSSIKGPGIYPAFTGQGTLTSNF